MKKYQINELPHYMRFNHVGLNPDAPVDKPQKSKIAVASYQTGEHGEVICQPVPEHLRRNVRDDSCELSNIMLGKLPEQLSQLQMTDAMETAEQITSACVRRFGKLQKQMDEIKNMSNINEEE